MTADRSHHSEHFYLNKNWLNLTVLEVYVKKLLFDPYVLFSVMAAMFFDGPKIPTSVLCRIPHELFIPSLVPNGPVVSEDKKFEKLLTMTDDDGRLVMAIAHMAFGQVS